MPERAHVLVVDDEKLIRWSVGERLTRTGYEVKTADSGEAALELIAAHRPDVALFDVRLPGIDGIATLQRALELHPSLVAVMMSAHSTVDLAVGAMKDGAVDFLVKPFALTHLDEVVARALATSRVRRSLAEPSVPQPLDAKTGAMVGEAPAFKELLAVLERLTASPATVLIEGESGSGKELVARNIHHRSARAQKPFLELNCAALPEHLLESELFGHERGAFTDAHALKRGLFENAHGGTVMLDEIGDLPQAGQAKLLRLLENRTFRRVGSSVEQPVDVRVIAATNASLEERVRENRFRNDLYFRLNVIRVRVPPLRERLEDLPLLATHFMAHYSHELGRPVPRGISPGALAALQTHSWPGNVRELRNVIERALVLHPTGAEEDLRREHLPPELLGLPQSSPSLVPHTVVEPGATLNETEKRLIVDAMDKARGNQSQAARALGITRDTLRYRLRKHGL